MISDPEEFAEGLRERSAELGLKPVICIICLLPCSNIGDTNARGEIKEYCDLCLPPEMITKPIGTWICKKCAKRVRLRGD